MTLWTSEWVEAATALRGELRAARSRAHVPPDFLGAFTDDPADLEVPRTSAGCWPSAACSAWPGRRSSAAAARRSGSRRWSARRCGRTTSRAGRSTWASTGSARRSCGTARPSSSGSTCRRSPRRGDLVPGVQRAGLPARTWPRCGPPPAATATAGASLARRSGPPTRRWPSGASCWPGPHKGDKKQQGLTIFLVPMSAPGIEVRPIATHDRARTTSTRCSSMTSG